MSVSLRNLVQLLLTLAFMAVQTEQLFAHPRRLTVAQMTELVRVYMAPDGGKYGFVVEDAGEETHFAGFRYFNVLTNDPNVLVIYMDHIAVDERTGDVWFANGCDAYTSQTLAQAQKALRMKIGISDTEYRRLRRPGPYCDGAPYVP